VLTVGNVAAASALALQTDGKIVVAGRRRASGTDGFVAARLNADGTTDTNFGVNGFFTQDFGGIGSYALASSLAIDANGAIVLGGYARPTISSAADFVLVRLTSSGALDSTFGTAGVTTTDLSSDDELNALVLDSSARIVAAGRSGTLAAVVRYSSTGILDATFGTNGSSLLTNPISNGGYSLTGLAIQSDGKLVAAGADTYPYPFGIGTLASFLVVRLFDTGAADPSFAGTGFSEQSFGLSSGSATCVLLTGTRIVAAGAMAGDVAVAQLYQ
jgi:uncharacterized delta-60 repeat protein